MIITRDEVKTYLQITSTTYDSLIDVMIEPTLYDMFDYTNNYFHNNNVRLRSHNFTFSTGSSTTGGTISVDGTNFSTWSFQSGDEIHVVNSARNDGIYTATSVSSATITISTTQTLKVEDSETFCTIVKMDVPKSVKPIVSAMIKSKIDSPGGNVKSERLGDYSITYGGSGEYPDGLLASLNKYRVVKFV
jgi:hypothetical protein